MKFQAPPMRKARIEIIPMIDTIFFLLVFFMITWLTVVKMSGLPMTLPRPSTAAGAAPVSVVLSVSPTGGYYVDSHKAAPGSWTTLLRERLVAHPNSVVVVNIAPEQKTQTLIDIMDRVNGAIAAAHSPAQVLVATPRVARAAGENKP